LYSGTSSGELWMSRDEGLRWQCIARHLPEIYAVEVAEAVDGMPGVEEATTIAIAKMSETGTISAATTAAEAADAATAA